MAGGRDQADGVHSNRQKLLEDQLKHFRDRYIELSSKYEFKYLCRRLARWWLHHDEKRVSKRGGTNERPEERLLNNYLLMQAYFLLAIKGLGFLAMMWSTVVLLGGLVTSLHRNDFWCLTVITMIQAARIFDNLQVHLLPSLLNLALRLFRIRIMPSYPTTANLSDAYFSWFFIQIRDFWSSTVEIVWSLLVLVVNLAVTFVLFLYQLGPLVCSALSWWRIWVHNFGDTGNDDGKANLTPALIIFYALVLLQGAFYLPWQLCDIVHEEVIRSVYRRCRLSQKWGHGVVKGYFLDTRVKCEQEPGSIADSNLVRYAVQLLDSELPDKYLSGARLLDTLIKQGEDIRSLLLLSRPKIQKLIDTLGLRSNTAYNREIRELAARILADLSSDLHLAQFPGTIQCISSLFQTNEPYCKKQNALDDELAFTVGREGSRVISAPCFLGPPIFETTVQRANRKDGKKSYVQYREGTGKELILHGLMILEGLASNQHNCKEICGSPGLIPKITAPIYSSKLIEDMKISGWTDVVNRSLKLLLKLIRSSGRTGRRLRSDLSSQMKAMSNLESIIINQGNEVDKELQMHAMEILTELAIEPPIHIDRRTEENLITSWMEIFLADEGEGRPGSMIRMTAGRTLAIHDV